MEVTNPTRPWYTRAAFAAAITALFLCLLTQGNLAITAIYGIIFLDVFALLSALVGLFKRQEPKRQLLILFLALLPWLVLAAFIAWLVIFQPPIGP